MVVAGLFLFGAGADGGNVQNRYKTMHGFYEPMLARAELEIGGLRESQGHQLPVLVGAGRIGNRRPKGKSRHKLLH